MRKVLVPPLNKYHRGIPAETALPFSRAQCFLLDYQWLLRLQTVSRASAFIGRKLEWLHAERKPSLVKFRAGGQIARLGSVGVATSAHPPCPLAPRVLLLLLVSPLRCEPPLTDRGCCDLAVWAAACATVELGGEPAASH